MKVSNFFVKFLGFVNGLLVDAGKQIGTSMNFYRWESDKRVIRFGNKFYESAKEYNISEADALDVYYTGYVIDNGKMVKKFNGYEIGIFYWIATDTGVIVITYTWKKERR